MIRSILIAAGLTAAGLLALVACGAQKSADADTAKTAVVVQPAPIRRKTVFDDQLKALDKAKAVEKQMQEDKEKTDKAIEDAGG